MVSRINGAYLLGKMVKYFEPDQVPLGWAQKVSIMSQDFNCEIRQEIAKYYKTMFKHLSIQIIQQTKVVERYVELLADEELEVQAEAINCLIWVFQKLPADQARAMILPTLTKILQTCQRQVMQSFLSQMGKICEALVNLGLFKDIEDDLMLLIQRSFIDNGNKVEDQWHYF